MTSDPQANARLPIISFEDFLKVDIRLGTVIDVRVFEEAKKAAAGTRPLAEMGWQIAQQL